MFTVSTLSILETCFPVCLVGILHFCSPENWSEESRSFSSCSPEKQYVFSALWSSCKSRHQYMSSVLDRVACRPLLSMKCVPDFLATCGKEVRFILWSVGCCLCGTSHFTCARWKWKQDRILTLISFPTTAFSMHLQRLWSTAVDWRGESWDGSCSKPERKWREWGWTRWWKSASVLHLAKLPVDETTCHLTRTKFECQPAPVHVLDSSGMALDYFQLDYLDTVLHKLV